jgi:hypothetical protein
MENPPHCIAGNTSMKIPVPDRDPRRSPAFAAALLVALVLAWRCISLGQADVKGWADPVAASGMVPSHGGNQYWAGQAEFLVRSYDAAAEHARNALLAQPLDGRGYRLLALIAETSGDRAQAQTLLEIAERRAPRDLATRMKLAAYALHAGDASRVVHEIDMLLRIEPELIVELQPRLVKLCDRNPAAIDAVAQALAAHPIWRHSFLDGLATSGDPKSADAVFARLAAGDGLGENEAAMRARLQTRIASQPAATTLAPAADLYQRVDWGPLEAKAHITAESVFNSIGMP